MTVKNRPHCGRNLRACRTECRKIMRSEKCLCPLVHPFHIQRLLHIGGIEPFLRILRRRIPETIFVRFFHTVNPWVKCLCNFLRLCHHNIRRQKGANRQRDFLRRDTCFHVNHRTLPQGMHACVRSACADALQRRIAEQQPQSLRQFAFHSDHRFILLLLPAGIIRSIVCDCQ